MTVLCTTNAVKSKTPIQASYLAYDTAITDFISTASDEVRDFCRRKFDAGTFTERFTSYDNPRHLFIAEPPIEANSLVILYDPVGLFQQYSTLVENTDYLVNYEEGDIEILTRTCFHRNGFRVTYSGGYAVTSGLVAVPSTVATATAMQAAFTLQRTVIAQMGETQSEKARQSLQVFTKAATQGLIDEVKGKLFGFRRQLVGRT